MHNQAVNIAKYPKYDRYQRKIASMIYKLFDKNTASLVRAETLATRGNSIFNTNKKAGINSSIFPENKQLAEELHKPIIKNFEKRK